MEKPMEKPDMGAEITPNPTSDPKSIQATNRKIIKSVRRRMNIIEKRRQLGRRHSRRAKRTVQKYQSSWENKSMYSEKKHGVKRLRDMHYCVVYPLDKNDRMRPYAKKVYFVAINNFVAKLKGVSYWIDKQHRIRMRSDLEGSYPQHGTQYKILHEQDLDHFVEKKLGGNLSPVVYEQ